MSKDIRTINLIFATAGFAMSLIGLILTMMGRFIEKRTRQFFIVLFVILDFYALSILTRELTWENTGSGWMIFSQFLFFAQGFLASIITVIITAFLLDQCGIRPFIKSPLLLSSIALWLVYVAILVSNLFTQSIYFVDEQNRYNRGRMFPLLIMPTVLIMLINLAIILMYKARLSVWQKRAFLIYSLVPMISMIIQAFIFGVHLIALSTVVAALFALLYIMSDQNEKYLMKEAENAKLKVDVLLAQIRPHFLFNSLTTIKSLCKKDPETAADAIGDFANFLRYNMDFLSVDKTIPFESELEHVREYIFLQKLRFGDDLTVNYDIKYTDFRIPTLTLQPLVENAIIHGVRKNEGGNGIVTVSAVREENHIDVTVTDNGPGFDSEAVCEDNERSHVGLRNVKQRIESTSGGMLKLDTAPGRGTKVTIIIPVMEGK